MDPLAILAVRRNEPPISRGFHLWPLIVLMLILLTVAVATLGSRTASPIVVTPTPTASDIVDREARVYAVSYRFGVFSPTNLRIHAGDTVRWKNDSPLPVRIVAQLQAGQKVPEFDSIGTVQPDGYFSYTFGTAGVFGYNNASNTNESGVIIVR
jgi:plastocyanin